MFWPNCCIALVCGRDLLYRPTNHRKCWLLHLYCRLFLIPVRLQIKTVLPGAAHLLDNIPTMEPWNPKYKTNTVPIKTTLWWFLLFFSKHEVVHFYTTEGPHPYCDTFQIRSTLWSCFCYSVIFVHLTTRMWPCRARLADCCSACPWHAWLVMSLFSGRMRSCDCDYSFSARTLIH